MSGIDVDFSKLLDPIRGNTGEAVSQRHSFLGRKGDLTIELHYGDFQQQGRSEAALYLWRHRGPNDKRGVYVPLSCLWMYVEGRGGNFNDSWQRMIPHLCEVLYGMITKSGLFRVMDAIIDYLDDLRKSPPDPGLFKDRNLQSFIAECDKEEVEFWYEVGGKRYTLN